MKSSPSRGATIEDVAAAAGVSRAAVSKVLRNAYGVSDAMRERVNTAMRELNYRPRIAARAMRGRTFTFGIEVPDFSNQFIARMLTGVTGALSGTGYQVVIAPAERGAHQGLRAINALVDRQVDGVIVVSPRVTQSDLERIATNSHVVMFGRHDTSSRYDTVVGDDAAGTAAVLEHLFQLGHRRIAHLTLDQAGEVGHSPHVVRDAQFRSVMRGAGLASDAKILCTEEGQDAAYLTVRKAIADGLASTAIFAAHDELAIGALRAVAEAQIDISVVGYDDVPIASHPALGLTTVYQPGEAMGARAGELLLERINGREVAAHERFPPELRVRTSSRPVPASPPG